MPIVVLEEVINKNREKLDEALANIDICLEKIGRLTGRTLRRPVSAQRASAFIQQSIGT